MCLGIFEIATAAYFTGTDGAVPEEGPKYKDLRPVALVSILYIVVLMMQLGTHWHYKSGLHFVEDQNPQLRTLLDRIVGNTIEYRGIFMVAMWTNAIFVNPAMAARIGAEYAALTYVYSFVYGWYGSMCCPIGFCSVTRMGMIGWLWICCFFKLAFGLDYQKIAESYGFPGLLVAAFIAVFGNNIGVMAIGSMPYFSVAKKGVEWDKKYEESRVQDV